MRKKFLLPVIITIVFAAAALLAGSRSWHISENKTAAGIWRPDKNELSEFLAEKSKLSRKSEEVSLAVVGDISYSRGVEWVVEKQKDANYPFSKVRDYLQNADLVFGNLETPITPGERIPNFSMLFRSDPGTEQALKLAGVSVVSLANNHTPNFGGKGLKDTIKYLDAAGINHAGAGSDGQEANQPAFLEAKGLKFAFLAYNDNDVVPPGYEAADGRPGTAFMRTDIMAEAVKEAKQKADFVIVSMHSGTEYVPRPNLSQTNFAHAAIDAGAEMVIGHHPHVVQTMEKYRGKYIFYSLGNFIFDQSWSQNTKDGLAARIIFDKAGAGRISFLPVAMKNLAQPEPADAAGAERILKRLDFPLGEKTAFFWNGGGYEKEAIPAVFGKEPEVGVLSSKKEAADLDKDGNFENYSLENGRLVVAEDSKNVWQSPDDWWVDDFVLADSTNDGIVDMNISLWKPGNFGPSKPFWVKENDMSVKNHFFVLDLANEEMKTIWGSSNLEAPNCEFKISDADNDGKNDLIVAEGNYEQSPECKGEYLAVWKWNGWGFSNEWRSEKGGYADLEIEKMNGKTYIAGIEKN